MLTQQRRLFGGTTVSRVTCSVCAATSAITEGFLDLSLPIGSALGAIGPIRSSSMHGGCYVWPRSGLCVLEGQRLGANLFIANAIRWQRLGRSPFLFYA